MAGEHIAVAFHLYRLQSFARMVRVALNFYKPGDRIDDGKAAVTMLLIECNRAGRHNRSGLLYIFAARIFAPLESSITVTHKFQVSYLPPRRLHVPFHVQRARVRVKPHLSIGALIGIRLRRVPRKLVAPRVHRPVGAVHPEPHALQSLTYAGLYAPRPLLGVALQCLLAARRIAKGVRVPVDSRRVPCQTHPAHNYVTILQKQHSHLDPECLYQCAAAVRLRVRKTTCYRQRYIAARGVSRAKTKHGTASVALLVLAAWVHLYPHALIQSHTVEVFDHSCKRIVTLSTEGYVISQPVI